MKRTTVYLTDEEVEGLRRTAAATGRSRAELIREGVQRVISEAPPRRFHSMGKGRGPSERPRRWDPDELYRKVFGQDERS